MSRTAVTPFLVATSSRVAVVFSHCRIKVWLAFTGESVGTGEEARPSGGPLRAMGGQTLAEVRSSPSRHACAFASDRQTTGAWRGADGGENWGGRKGARSSGEEAEFATSGCPVRAMRGALWPKVHAISFNPSAL